MTRQSNKKQLRLLVGEVLGRQPSVAHISYAILEGLKKEPTNDSLETVTQIIEHHFCSGDRYVLLVTQKVFRGHLHRDREYLIIPHEKGDWASKRTLPQPRYIDWDEALPLLNAKVDSIFFDLQQCIFEDEDETALRDAVYGAVQNETVEILVNINEQVVYF